MRFPYYTDEWKEQRLEDLGFFIGGGTPDTTNQQFWTGKIPWISSSDLSVDGIDRIFKTRFINDDAIKSSATKLVPKGGILMISRVGIGKFAVADEDLCTSQDFTNLVTNQNAYFLCYYFSARSKDFVKLGQGTSIKGFTIQDIKSSVFPVPTLQEQENISSFLSVIDSRIHTQRKIIEQIKSQMLVLEEILLTGKSRLHDNDNNPFKDWKREKLGDIGKTYNGISGKSKQDFGLGKKYIQYKQIFDSSKIKLSDCALVNISENENQNDVKFGDVFFTVSSETPEEIGMSSVLLEEVENVFLNSFCFGFRTHSFEKLIPEFSQFFFRSKVFRNEIVKLAQGSTRYNISKSGFLKLDIVIPRKDEQLKISACLSALDKKVNLEKDLLLQYENQKKYLLANLFI